MTDSQISGPTPSPEKNGHRYECLLYMRLILKSFDMKEHAEIFSKFGNKITGFNETDWSNLISQCLTPLSSNGYNSSQKMAYSINQRSNIGH